MVASVVVIVSDPLTFDYTFESTKHLFIMYLQVDMSTIFEEAVQ
jgi:hypothetical protein